MIQVTAHMKILLAVEPVDFRAGIDRLAQQCREVLEEDPFGGTLFIFRSRKGSVFAGGPARPAKRLANRHARPQPRAAQRIVWLMAAVPPACRTY